MTRSPKIAMLALLLSACGAPVGNVAAPAERTDALVANNAVVASPANVAQSGGEGASSGRELPEGAANLDFIVVNRTGRTITGIAITPEGEGAPWSADILTPRDVPNDERGAASYSRDIELCLWAVRATFEGGQTRDFPAVNLCDTVRVELR
ncbi:MAG: hypothetical protein AB7O91_10025 [Sphingomonas sp.]